MFAAARRTAAIPRARILTHPRTPFSTRTVSPQLHRPRPQDSSSYRRTPPIHAQQTRPLTLATRWKLGFREASKNIWRKNPILLPLAFLSIATATAFFSYIVYVEFTHERPQYAKFPPPVEAALRSAVFYTDVDLNPPKALAAYKDALRIGAELGMHPLSDEIMGIKLKVAAMLESAGLVKPAIEVLEHTRDGALKAVEAGRKKEGEEAKMRADAPSKAGNARQAQDVNVNREALNIDNPEILEMQKRMEDLEAYEKLQRDKTMKKVVGIQMKLAELYASDYIQDIKKATSIMESAVDLSMKEINRRQSLGLPMGGRRSDGLDDDEYGDWLNFGETATTLSALADRYLEQGWSELALPLFLHALKLIHLEDGDSPSCRQVTLLNDVAYAMAGRAEALPPSNSPSSPSSPSGKISQKEAVVAAETTPAMTREQALDASRQWSNRAIEMGNSIQPPVRTQECDISCFASKFNLAQIAEHLGQRKEAEKMYRDLKAKVRSVDDQEFTEHALSMIDEALEQLSKK